MVAMTGELSIHGSIKPVGGVSAKIYAAKQAGVRRILIPKDNWQELYGCCGIEVIGIETVDQALEGALIKKEDSLNSILNKTDVLVASGVEA